MRMEIAELEVGDEVTIEADEAVADETDSSEIYRRGDDLLLHDTGVVEDTRDDEVIIALDRASFADPESEYAEATSVRVSGGTFYPVWELDDDAPEGIWKPIPAPAGFVSDIERDSGGVMWDLADELHELVDDEDGVMSAQMDGYRAYVVPSESEAEAEEMAEWDVDATDDVDVVNTEAVGTEYATAFKVAEE